MTAALVAVCLLLAPATALAFGYRPVISQVFGGGGSASPTYGYDYIELHNPAPLDVSVEGWSVQYASVSGTFNSPNRTDLHGVIPAGGYLLVRGGGFGPALPTAPDITGGLNLSATTGKLALVRDTTYLAGNFTSPTILDLVGYGSTVTAWEGPAGAYVPALSQTTLAVRKLDGNQDTNNNGADFDVLAASGVMPRNSASTPHALAGPMDITLTGGSLTGPVAAGTTIGTLASVDPERTGPFTYSLVSGTGDTDNALFGITGNTLSTVALLDPSVKGTYSIRVRSTDPAWLGYERVLTVTARPRVIDTGGSRTTTTTPRLPATGYPPAPRPRGSAWTSAALVLLALASVAAARRSILRSTR